MTVGLPIENAKQVQAMSATRPFCQVHFKLSLSFLSCDLVAIALICQVYWHFFAINLRSKDDWPDVLEVLIFETGSTAVAATRWASRQGRSSFAAACRQRRCSPPPTKVLDLLSSAEFSGATPHSPRDAM